MVATNAEYFNDKRNGRMWRLSYLTILTVVVSCLGALSHAHQPPDLYHIGGRTANERGLELGIGLGLFIPSSFKSHTYAQPNTRSCFVFPQGSSGRKQSTLKKIGNFAPFNVRLQTQCQYKQNDDDMEDRAKPKRRYRNGSANRGRPSRARTRSSSSSARGRNSNSNYSRQNTRRTRGRSLSSHSIFTRTLIAPPLEQRQLSNNADEDDDYSSDSAVANSSISSPSKKTNENGIQIQKFHSEDDILSPAVVERNEENCMTYICGELPITYTNDANTVTNWLMDNVNDNYTRDTVGNGPGGCVSNTFLGFDVEAAPNLPWRTPINTDFIGRPATVQLSTPYSSLVVHLSNNDVISPLQALLSDESILKVGAGIDEDMLELYRWNQSLDARGRFDIGGVGSNSKRSRVGLQKLVRAIVGVELPKSKKIAMSDWSKIPLSSKQLVYASRDAWAGAAVMENLGRFHRDEMHIDVISSLIQKNERDMADVDERARRRKKAKMKTKQIIADMKELASFLDAERNTKFDRQSRLQEIMPKEVKKEMNRLQVILDETAPDGLLFFEAKELGLDFSFVDQKMR